MKKSLLVKIIALGVLGGSIIGCKGSKKLNAPKGEVEVVVPCSGPDYFTTKKVFRANSVGESSDQVTSKKKALANARNEMASSIQTTVKTVTDNYVNSREFNNKEELEERFESLNREVVNQRLSGITTICEKLVKTQEGRYKTYIAIELSADELVTEYNERLSKDDKLKIDYDYEKFKETFEAEMDKMDN
jgi:hypothetical protein